MSDPLRVRINRCILTFHLLNHEISLLDFMGILIVMSVSFERANCGKIQRCDTVGHRNVKAPIRRNRNRKKETIRSTSFQSNR